MKIGSLPQLPPVADAGVSSTGRASGGVAAATAAGTDQVDVSSAGAQIQALGGGGDFDSAKVDAIRQAIREGRFTVNAEAIADRLIADATALLGPRTH